MWSSLQACSMNFTKSSNGGNGTGYSLNTRKNRSRSLWSKNSTQTSTTQRTVLWSTVRCGGMLSDLTQRPSTTSLTPSSSLLTDKIIRRTHNTYTRTQITKPSQQHYAHPNEDSSWTPMGPHGSCCGRISLRSLKHGAYFLILTLPLPLTLLILMLIGQGWYMA